MAQSGVSVLSENPSRTLKLGSAHALAAHEQPQGALGQDLQARRGWPHDSVVCPLTQTEALRRPPLAFLRASGRPRSCPSFARALPLPVARLIGCRESPGRQSRALDGRKAHDAKILPATCSGDQCSSTMKRPHLCSQPLACPAGIAVRTCPPLEPRRHHSLSCGLFLSSLRLILELSFV
mgnify:CR=1 FL=1